MLLLIVFKSERDKLKCEEPLEINLFSEIKLLLDSSRSIPSILFLIILPMNVLLEIDWHLIPQKLSVILLFIILLLFDEIFIP